MCFGFFKLNLFDDKGSKLIIFTLHNAGKNYRFYE